MATVGTPLARTLRAGRIIFAMLLLVAALTVGACAGGSGDKAASTTAATSQAVGAKAHDASARTAPGLGNAGHGQPASGNPEERRSDRLAGVYVEAARICAVSTPERVAKNVRSKSSDPRAIARTLAGGYLPKLRKAAFKGCLSALG